MDEKYLALIATFDDETINKMESLQHILHENGLIGTQTPGIPHHITIALYDPSFENEIKERAKTVAAKTASFAISFNHIGLFGLRVLFLGPDVNHELLTLHEALAVNNIHPVREWTPHATLLIDEADNLHQALDLVAQHFESIEARIVRLKLYAIDPVRLIVEYPLEVQTRP